jgi:hypothetical protein
MNCTNVRFVVRGSGGTRNGVNTKYDTYIRRRELRHDLQQADEQKVDVCDVLELLPQIERQEGETVLRGGMKRRRKLSAGCGTFSTNTAQLAMMVND